MERHHREAAEPPARSPAIVGSTSLPPVIGNRSLGRMLGAGRTAHVARMLGATPAVGNRSLARILGGADQESQADRVAIAALGAARPAPGSSVAEAVGAVTGVDLRDVRVSHEPVPGAEGVARDGRIAMTAGAGAFVLAHEYAHVALGHDTDGLGHRFVREERPRIGNLDAIIADARRMANATSELGMMRWGRFTAAAGGSALQEIVEGAGSMDRSDANQMRVRYLYTVRCGLVDMRHFYQLMYLGLTLGNQSAVYEGREHELQAEASSRFAPEDTVSNALGALFGSMQSFIEGPETFLSNLRTYLRRCGPADWDRMPTPEQDTVVNYYSARDAGGVPVHQNETAVPAPPVTTTTAAEPIRGMFPFVQSVTAGQWNTYSGIVE